MFLSGKGENESDPMIMKLTLVSLTSPPYGTTCSISFSSWIALITEFPAARGKTVEHPTRKISLKKNLKSIMRCQGRVLRGQAGHRKSRVEKSKMVLCQPTSHVITVLRILEIGFLPRKYGAVYTNKKEFDGFIRWAREGVLRRAIREHIGAHPHALAYSGRSTTCGLPLCMGDIKPRHKPDIP